MVFDTFTVNSVWKYNFENQFTTAGIKGLMSYIKKSYCVFKGEDKSKYYSMVKEIIQNDPLYKNHKEEIIENLNKIAVIS
jgi:phosphoenolpyruvate carboxylase